MTNKLILILLAFGLAGPAALAGPAHGSKQESKAACYYRQDLSARAAGFIEKVYVNDGDEVKKGTLLAEMDHRLLSTAVKEAQAGVAAAKAQLSLAKDALSRLKKLSSSASEQELVGAQIKVQQAEAQLMQATAIYERNKIQLGDAFIRAEIDGRVSGLPRVKGLFVQAGQSLGRVEASPDSCRVAKE